MTAGSRHAVNNERTENLARHLTLPARPVKVDPTYELGLHALKAADDADRRADRATRLGVCALAAGLAACVFSVLALVWIGVVT